MKSLRIWIIALSSLFSFDAQAQTPCQGALVTSTMTRLESSSANWQLAQLIDESQYNARKAGGDTSAIIYGMPMGANYSEFRQNISTHLNSTDSRWSNSQLSNMLWTGLDPAAASAYAACLNSQVFNQGGLQAAVVGAGDNNIIIRVRWSVPGNPNPAMVTWTAAEIGGAPLRVNFPQGDTTITVPRPAVSTALAASFGGYTTAPIMIEPLPVTQLIALTLTEQISRGREFMVMIDPSADLGPLTNLYSYDRAGAMPLSSGQLLTGRYYPSNQAWVTRGVVGNGLVSGSWCAQEQCSPPVPYCLSGTCMNRKAGQMPRHLRPEDQDMVIFGHALRFDDAGHVFHGNRPIGFLVIPRFASPN